MHKTEATCFLEKTQLIQKEDEEMASKLVNFLESQFPHI